LPAGCDDNDPQYWQDQDDSDLTHSKHTYDVHAEKNAIYNCMLHNMTGAKLYTTQFPCNTCAQAIIQVGIEEVIYPRKKQHDSHLLINQAVDKMFKAAGVKTTAYTELGISDVSFIKQLIMMGENEFN
jgi:dCMP deaminase